MRKSTLVSTLIAMGILGFCPLPLRSALFTPSQAIAMPQPLLDDDTIRDRIQKLPGWTTDGKALYATRKFKNFIEAVAFVNRLVTPAEAAQHHPDLRISYNKVWITLTTHDSGGLTELDFQLAQTISEIHGVVD